MTAIKILFFFIWGLSYSIAQDSCTIERTQSPGQCKLLEECPDVIEDNQKGRKHTRCRFEEKAELVCCPIQQVNLNDNKNNDTFSRIHEKKCHEYQSAVYITIYSIALGKDEPRRAIKVDNCGHKTVPLKVRKAPSIGAESAEETEFPHMALIGYETGPNSNQVSWACEGTLLSERFVLTAAKCLGTRTFGDPKFVRLGGFDDTFALIFNVGEALRHPLYTNLSLYNDIALLKLDRDVQFSGYMRPACLPSYSESNGDILIAWRGLRSSSARKLTLDKFSQNECNEIFTGLSERRLRNGIHQQSQMCAGSKDQSRDTCQDGFGGTLQVYHSNEYCMYIVVGIASFGFDCGKSGFPSVYTRVYNYVDWIETTVWPNEKF